MSTLAIIIVSWNTRDLLRACLKAVEHSLADSGIGGKIIVVDNASSDGTPAMLHTAFPQVHLLEPGRNLGFVGGNNLALHHIGIRDQGSGIRHASEAPESRPPAPDPPPPYILLLNPDTEPVADALPCLVQYLDSHPDVVAVGPRLCFPDGRTQSSRRRFPTRLTFFWESTPLQRLWPGNPWARHYHCADQDDTTEQCVDWLVGAALLVRSSAIAAAGFLDERFFMYSEELEWQHRLQHAAHSTGMHPHLCRVVYLPAAVVIHHEGQSSEQVPLVRHLHFQRSKLLLAEMWYGAAFASLLRRFLWLCYLWELLLESAKYLLRHRRTLRRQRIVVYATVLHKLR